MAGMSQSLSQRIYQGFRMTPANQLSMEILVANSMELEQRITEKLESNPLLELDEEGMSPDEPAGEVNSREDREEREDRDDPWEQGGQDPSGESWQEETPPSPYDSNEPVPLAASQPGEETSAAEAMESASLPDEDSSPLDDSWESRWDEGVTPVHRSSPGQMMEEDQEFQQGTTVTLKDHLLSQLDVSPFSPTDNAIARAVIDALDDDGYISPDETVETLTRGAQYILLEDRLLREGLDFSQVDAEAEIARQEEIVPEEVLSVIHRLQCFDPVGTSCFTRTECLCVQLRQLKLEREQDPEPRHEGVRIYDQAAELLQIHQDLLARKDFSSILRKMKIREEQLKRILELLKTLDPCPGARFTDTDKDYVVPDVAVRKTRNGWKAELVSPYARRLRINRSYDSLDQKFVRDMNAEAKMFVSAVERRENTILKVAQCITERQKDFFEQGPMGLRPMILSQVAEEVGLHESTISRVVNGKYMATPQGVREMSFFFTSGVSADDGGSCSSRAVQERIRKYVSEEDKTRPLSDGRISEMLAEEGIRVARRTVAKYREEIRIPPSSERKILS